MTSPVLSGFFHILQRGVYTAWTQGAGILVAILESPYQKLNLPKFQKLLTSSNAIHLQIGSTHIVFNKMPLFSLTQLSRLSSNSFLPQSLICISLMVVLLFRYFIPFIDKQLCEPYLIYLYIIHRIKQ